MSSIYIKDPEAVVDYTVDWNSGYLDGDSLASSHFTVAPSETNGLTVDTETHDGATASVTLAGGVAGHVYRVTNQITTTGGRTDERSLTIRVTER